MSFRVERRGESLRGLAQGIDRRHLERLARGETEVDADLDLHGLLEAEARRAVDHAVREAYDTGFRCVLIIHGRGRHSLQGPVLREALPGWLTTPPLGGLVMAFATALPRDGGPGATYVLLRRRRRGR